MSLTRPGSDGRTLRERRDRVEASRFLYLDRLERPLHIIRGTEDEVVPAYLAAKLFTGLRRLGQRVTCSRYEGEGHRRGHWQQVHQVDALIRRLHSFDRHPGPA